MKEMLRRRVLPAILFGVMLLAAACGSGSGDSEPPGAVATATSTTAFEPLPTSDPSLRLSTEDIVR